MRAHLAVTVAVLASTGLLPQPAGAAPARSALPQLAVTDVTFTLYAFRGEPATRIRLCERTHNFGRGGTPRRPRNVMVVQGPGISKRVATRLVPRLPGTAAARRGRHFSHYGCGSGEPVPLDLPPGAYEVQICTDRRIRQRPLARNTCFIRDKAFYVIKRDWTGTTSGEGGSPVGNQSWQAASVAYRFLSATNAREGQFVYSFFAGAPGNVSYQLSGTFQGCTAAGGATFQPDFGRLVMDYRREHYTLVGEVPVGSQMPITVTCPGSAEPGVAAAVNPFLTNGVADGFTNPLPFGTQQLTGQYLLSVSGVQKYRSTWTLR
jgi:hypothetical protein